MPSGEQAFHRQIVSAAGEALMYPVNHPVKMAKVIALGGAAFVGTVMGAQASMILAEHGSYRPSAEFPRELEQ